MNMRITLISVLIEEREDPGLHLIVIKLGGQALGLIRAVLPWGGLREVDEIK